MSSMNPSHTNTNLFPEMSKGQERLALVAYLAIVGLTAAGVANQAVGDPAGLNLKQFDQHPLKTHVVASHGVESLRPTPENPSQGQISQQDLQPFVHPRG